MLQHLSLLFHNEAGRSRYAGRRSRVQFAGCSQSKSRVMRAVGVPGRELYLIYLFRVSDIYIQHLSNYCHAGVSVLPPRLPSSDGVVNSFEEPKYLCSSFSPPFFPKYRCIQSRLYFGYS